jgi:UDP-N-acetylmuramate-alanine ligase
MKSNTSRRAIFQHDYPVALAECDEVILSAPWKKDDLPPEQLINIPKIVDDLNAHGSHAQLIAHVDDIVAYLAEQCRPGDVVLGMSGSAFDGLHKKLASALEAKLKELHAQGLTDEQIIEKWSDEQINEMWGK